MPFLASVSFLGLPVYPCLDAGAETQSANDEFPGNIRILWGGLRPFLASVSFRELSRPSGVSM